MPTPKSTIDQWRVLAAVVDEGSFAAAAHRLHRSQSAISYAVAQLQRALGVRLMESEGRRAQLTSAGRVLLQRSRGVVDQLVRLEALAAAVEGGWESELSLVVDAAFPQPRLLQILAQLRARCGETTLRLDEAVLSGAEDAIRAGVADLVVTTRIPQGFAGDWVMDIQMLAVAAPLHPLHGLHRPLTLDDLAVHTQVVVRDSGQQPRDEGWLGARHRWTVAGLDASRAAVKAGLAYAWLPAHLVADDLAAGTLRRLPLAVGGERRMALHVVVPKGEAAGPAARVALELFRDGPEAGPATPVARRRPRQ